MPEQMEITAASYGPDGVGRRNDGKVVFVARAVPGDLVEVESVRETSSRIEARIGKLVRPSQHRRAVTCPVQQKCGGCPWMHIEREAQLLFKTDLLCQTLRGLKTEISPIVHDANELGYRQRARLQLAARKGEPLRIGFFSHGTHDIVPLRACPICLGPLSDAISSMAGLVINENFSASAEFVADDDGRVMAGTFLAKAHPNPQKLATFLGERSNLAGCLVISPDRRRGQWGLEHSLSTVQDEPRCTIPLFPTAFSQANPFVNRLLVAHVVELITGLGNTRELMELYAGHGNFTYPLATRGFRINAVEKGVNVALLPHAKGVRFTRKNAAAFLRRALKEKRQPTTLLLDPPRQGAKDTIPLIAEMSPQHVVYVSCDPNTFARDASSLIDAGYRTVQITPFDMMPQTFHIELVALFVKP